MPPVKSKKPPRQILQYMREPQTWNSLAFETAIRNELELTHGTLQASDELLLGSLIVQVEAMLDAIRNIEELGQLTAFNSGISVSPWVKIRNESMDKIVRLLNQLAITAKNRTKHNSTTTEVDELFEFA